MICLTHPHNVAVSLRGKISLGVDKVDKHQKKAVARGALLR